MKEETTTLAVLGSTGSIGRQTLDVVRALPGKFRVVGLAGGNNTSLLAKQIREFNPQLVYCLHEGQGADFTSSGFVFTSPEEMAQHPDVDIVVVATPGKSGLMPTLAAVKAGKKVALANKESLVMAGEIITSQACLSGAQLLPVDSEHSAIWQCLESEEQKVAKLILTASGGAFYGYSSDRLAEVTPEQALRHPSWQMGKKVTIDSATLMNKGLEVIEAHWLFNMPFDNIGVLVHSQSIVHAMVEFADGSVKALLSQPDMRLPIQYALTYPERVPNPSINKLDWSNIPRLTFEEPAFDVFPCLKLAIEAGKRGGTYPAVLCAADEVAVDLFLSRRIRFLDIAVLVERVLEQHQCVLSPTLDQIISADEWARESVNRIVTGDGICG